MILSLDIKIGLDYFTLVVPRQYLYENKKKKLQFLATLFN